MFKHLLALAAVTFSTAALAQVSVSDAWVRATVPVQKTAGAFLTLKSTQAARLVGASSPAAGRVDMHQMEMTGQTMKMHAVDAIALPAGETVDLAKAGYHLMLLDLKQQLKEGGTIPVTLTVEDAAHQRERIVVSVPVKAIGYSAPGAPGMHH